MFDAAEDVADLFRRAEAPAQANRGAAKSALLFKPRPALQLKLLRVLREREIMRVGESVARKVDTRVLSATNRNLGQAIREGRFRDDLFYRLQVIEIGVPPLRERKEDILPLARREPFDSVRRTLAGVETDHIQRVLRLENGNRTRAAKTLGISPATLWRKMKNIPE